MKYRLKQDEEKFQFRPYTVSFVIETPEEHEIFHDHVACRIAERSNFIGNVFRAGHEPIGICSGEVPLRSFDETTP